MKTKIPVAISHCLLGACVRYDGSHSLDTQIKETLGNVFEWEPVCPEMEAGLGVPRERIVLLKTGDIVKLTGEKTGRDYTGVLERHAALRVRTLSHVRGFILKGKSPSCGIGDVRSIGDGGEERNDGSGVFVKAVKQLAPQAPLESPERLHDPQTRKLFVDQVFAYDRAMGGNRKSFTITGKTDI